MAKTKPEPEPILAPFEGQTVATSTIVIRRAGDGLSESVKVDPVTLRKGQRVFVVLETVVDEIGFKPIKDTAMLSRKHVLLTEVATIVDVELVSEVMDRQRARIEEAKAAAKVAAERAEGVRTLADGDEEDDAAAVFQRQHFAGVHALARVEGCLLCDAEAEQEAREAAQP